MKLSLKIIGEFYNGNIVKDYMKTSVFKKYCGKKYLDVAKRFRDLIIEKIYQNKLMNFVRKISIQKILKK